MSEDEESFLIYKFPLMPLTQFPPIAFDLLPQLFTISPVSLIFPSLFPFFLSSNIYLFFIFWLDITYKQYGIKGRT